MNRHTSPPYLDRLDPARQNVWHRLSAFRSDFVLAGGTAIMLQIGHRLSFDFDCFSEKPLQHDLVLRLAKSIFGSQIKPHLRTEEILSLETTKNIEITFVSHPFPILKTPLTTDSISLFHLDDLAANKAYVIGRRPAWRDYVDLFIMLKWKLYTLDTLIRFAQKKFTGEFHDKLFLEQLTYFADIEIVPVKFLKDSYSSDEIKSYLEKKVADYVNKVLS